MSNKLSKHAGGGELYTPAMMQYDGISWYTGTETYTGTAETFIATFTQEEFTGAGKWLVALGDGHFRLLVYLSGSDNATEIRRNTAGMYITDATGTLVRITGTTNVCDGKVHSIYITYDSVAGTASFIIDGNTEEINLDAPDHEVNAGTLATGQMVAYDLLGGNTGQALTGSMGFVGYDTSIRPYSDCFTSEGKPKEADLSDWMYFNPHGDMVNNYGTAANRTISGTISGTIVVSDDGSTGHPHLGINTVGDAAAADIAQGKIAWVDGKEIVGVASPYAHEPGGVNGVLLHHALPVGQAGSYDIVPDDVQVLDTDAAFSTRPGCTLDAYGWSTGDYLNWIFTPSIAIPTGRQRKASVTFKCNTATPTADTLIRFHFNFTDANNEYYLQIHWNTVWYMTLRKVEGGSSSNLYGSVSLSHTTGLIYGTAEVWDDGDTVWVNCRTHDQTGSSNGEATYRYNQIGRFNKSALTYRVQQTYDEFEFREFSVIDL